MDILSSPVIELRQVAFAYPGRPPVLDNLDFTLSPGQRLGVIGPNGAGKSTLLKLCVGLLRPTGGCVTALGKERRKEEDFREVRAAVGYLFQDPDDQLFCPTVIEDVAFGPRNLGHSAHDAAQAARSALADLKMGHLENRSTWRLSGGEKRLAALAGVLAMRPRALLLDEPTAGLDDEHAEALAAILRASELAWTVVTHDKAFLAAIGAEVLSLEGGRLRPR